MGWVGHGGQAMGQGHGAGDNAFHCSWDARGGHTHHTWRVPAGRGGPAVSGASWATPQPQTPRSHAIPTPQPHPPDPTPTGSWQPQPAEPCHIHSPPLGLTPPGLPAPHALTQATAEGVQGDETAPAKGYSKQGREFCSASTPQVVPPTEPAGALLPIPHSPIGSPIELGVHHGRVHAGPVGGRCQVVLVDTVLQAVRDAAWAQGASSDPWPPSSLSPGGSHPGSHSTASPSPQMPPDGPTCDGPADLAGCLLAHLNGGLLTVPRSVGSADEVGRILQWTLAKAREHRAWSRQSHPQT